MNPLFLCLQFHPMTSSSLTWRCGFYEPIRITNSWFGSSPISLEFSNRPYCNILNMLSRRGLMVVWLASVMASADDEACALQKALGEPKVRNNYVGFYQYDGIYHDYGPPVQSVQFDETSHSITQGQPYEGVSSVDGHTLDVRAGRHGSEEVAQDFRAGITGNNALGERTSFRDPPLPAELNFAVFGNLSMTIDGATRACQEMRIAQGHAIAKNNWWIAGTKCSQQDNGLRCPCSPSDVTFFADSDISVFKVRVD